MSEMDPLTQSAERAAAREEYVEAALSFRHYSSLRFAIFSIYVAIVAAVGGVALGIVGDAKPNFSGRSVAAWGALLVTLTFFICERACLRQRRYFVELMKTLEKRLGYTSMTNLPHGLFVSPANALAVLFGINVAFWVYVIWQARNVRG